MGAHIIRASLEGPILLDNDFLWEHEHVLNLEPTDASHREEVIRLAQQLNEEQMEFWLDRTPVARAVEVALYYCVGQVTWEHARRLTRNHAIYRPMPSIDFETIPAIMHGWRVFRKGRYALNIESII